LRPTAGLVGHQQIGAFVSEALTLAPKRRLAPVVAGRFTLDRVVDAYRELESNCHGKVVVIPRYEGQAASENHYPRPRCRDVLTIILAARTLAA